MVATIPADVPLSKRANAKIVPATGAIVQDSRSWMAKRSAFCGKSLSERKAPAVIRIALLTKSANVKSARDSSIMKKPRQWRIADSERRYLASSRVEYVVAGTCPHLTSKSRRRTCTMPLPR